MSLIQFVENYSDLSTDKGYQFKFHCDRCHNGFMTRFRPSTLGMAESAMRVAGDIFGGVFRAVGNSAYDVRRAVGGSAHDTALEEAVREGKEYFHQCTRCGKWVCPDVCWNERAGMCDECAPKLEVEMAAAHARAQVDAAGDQLRNKAAKVDYVANIDMGPKAVLAAPGAPAAGARCAGCGAAWSAGARFCQQCGASRPASGCPGCGASIAPNAKFCAQCGAAVA